MTKNMYLTTMIN